MKTDLISELTWRGLIHDIVPGTQHLLNNEIVTGYIGFDPTAPSLHIGNLVSIILLKHLELAGHNPIALIGGATVMIGDPSGKIAERGLISDKTISDNIESIKNQLSLFLDFDKSLLLNNADWFGNMGFIHFMRDIGKHVTVSNMLSKESVKNRMETGISFTEFSYQLVQGFDFVHLNRHHNCKLQMGGSDQWGNMTTGMDLVSKMNGNEVFSITSPLITKSDRTKFGKSEQGNIWLDPNLTSPYNFFQFWLNLSDDDAKKFIKIFTFRSKEEIEELEKLHVITPSLRLLQKVLAEDVTKFVHGDSELESAILTTNTLFGSGKDINLLRLDMFEGVKIFNVLLSELKNGISVIDLLNNTVFKSKGEARKMINANGISVNKTKISEDIILTQDDVINDNFILIQRGKKDYFIFKTV